MRQGCAGLRTLRGTLVPCHVGAGGSWKHVLVHAVRAEVDRVQSPQISTKLCLDGRSHMVRGVPRELVHNRGRRRQARVSELVGGKDGRNSKQRMPNLLGSPIASTGLLNQHRSEDGVSIVSIIQFALLVQRG